MSAISADEWWRAVGEQRLLLLRCLQCRRCWLPWLSVCPTCGDADEVTTETATGRGRVYSWVTACWPPDAPDIPRTTAAVALDEGPILYGRLHIGNDELVPDVPVKAHFAVGPDGPVVEFVPVSEPQTR